MESLLLEVSKADRMVTVDMITAQYGDGEGAESALGDRVLMEYGDGGPYVEAMLQAGWGYWKRFRKKRLACTRQLIVEPA